MYAYFEAVGKYFRLASIYSGSELCILARVKEPGSMRIGGGKEPGSMHIKGEEDLGRLIFWGRER